LKPELLDMNHIAFLNAILFAAGRNDCVHLQHLLMNSPDRGNLLRLRMRIERPFRAVLYKIPYFLTFVKDLTGNFDKIFLKHIK
jgi:hypothetical protein